MKKEGMRQLETCEIQNRLLPIIDDIAKILNKRGIQWYLGHGTLLGAARGKGFIPWDDDIDIWIPIEVYQNAMKAIEAESKYSVYNFYDDNDYVISNSSKVYEATCIMEDETEIGKLYNYPRGLAVDVFALVGADNHSGLKRIKIDICRKMVGVHYLADKVNSRNGLNPIILIGHKVDCFFGHNTYYWKKKYLAHLKSLCGKEKIADTLNYNIYDAEDFKSTVLLEFEGRKFPAPSGYAHILTSRYGEWRTLPPQEERVSHHGKKYYIRIEDEKST